MDLLAQADHQEQAVLLEAVVLQEPVEAEGLLEQADHQAHLELAVLLELEARLTGLLTLEEAQLTVQIAALSSSLQEVLPLGTDRFTQLKVM
jgi:hypothetical protein